MTTKSKKAKVLKSVKTAPTTLRPTVSTRPVSLKLASILRELDTALVMEFGPENMTYVVLGEGMVIGASSGEHGFVLPDVTPEPIEGRVYESAELWGMPDGTTIESPVLGKGVIRAAGKVTNTDLDDRVAEFASGAKYVLPVPGSVLNPPWDHVIRVVRPDIGISTKYADEA